MDPLREPTVSERWTRVLGVLTLLTRIAGALTLLVCIVWLCLHPDLNTTVVVTLIIAALALLGVSLRSHGASSDEENDS